MATLLGKKDSQMPVVFKELLGRSELCRLLCLKRVRPTYVL